MHFKPVTFALILGAEACSGSSQNNRSEQRFQVEVTVESDPGEGLAGAVIARGGRELGRTTRQGTIRLALAGQSGDTVALEVSCPEGYASPEKPLQLSLRPLVGDVVPRYRAFCQASVRSLVVAIRAKGGSDVPIKYHGREIARTDTEGSAHALLRVPPSEPITFVLDTGSAAHAQLRPKSPEFTVNMPARDEVAVFDQTFSTEAPPRPKGTGRGRPAPAGPIKITRRP